jgi:hypothetical protein
VAGSLLFTAALGGAQTFGATNVSGQMLNYPLPGELARYGDVAGWINDQVAGITGGQVDAAAIIAWLENQGLIPEVSAIGDTSVDPHAEAHIEITNNPDGTVTIAITDCPISDTEVGYVFADALGSVTAQLEAGIRVKPGANPKISLSGQDVLDVLRGITLRGSLELNPTATDPTVQAIADALAGKPVNWEIDLWDMAIRVDAIDLSGLKQPLDSYPPQPGPPPPFTDPMPQPPTNPGTRDEYCAGKGGLALTLCRAEYDTIVWPAYSAALLVYENITLPAWQSGNERYQSVLDCYQGLPSWSAGCAADATLYNPGWALEVLGWLAEVGVIDLGNAARELLNDAVDDIGAAIDQAIGDTISAIIQPIVNDFLAGITVDIPLTDLLSFVDWPALDYSFSRDVAYSFGYAFDGLRDGTETTISAADVVAGSYLNYVNQSYEINGGLTDVTLDMVMGAGNAQRFRDMVTSSGAAWNSQYDSLGGLVILALDRMMNIGALNDAISWLGARIADLALSVIPGEFSLGTIPLGLLTLDPVARIDLGSIDTDLLFDNLIAKIREVLVHRWIFTLLDSIEAYGSFTLRLNPGEIKHVMLSDVTTVEIDPSQLATAHQLEVGDTLGLQHASHPATGVPLGAAASYHNSDPSVVSYDPVTHQIEALAPGVATITVQHELVCNHRSNEGFPALSIRYESSVHRIEVLAPQVGVIPNVSETPPDSLGVPTGGSVGALELLWPLSALIACGGTGLLAVSRRRPTDGKHAA